MICKNKKNMKDNFLNSLCALPCVILSADCSAIVFRMLLLMKRFASFKKKLGIGCMSSSQDFLGCTISKKVEEHCPRAFEDFMKYNIFAYGLSFCVFSVVQQASDISERFSW